jgi:energy-converting hydrogenase Eha subunit E
MFRLWKAGTATFMFQILLVGVAYGMTNSIPVVYMLALALPMFLVFGLHFGDPVVKDVLAHIAYWGISAIFFFFALAFFFGMVVPALVFFNALTILFVINRVQKYDKAKETYPLLLTAAIPLVGTIIGGSILLGVDPKICTQSLYD